MNNKKTVIINLFSILALDNFTLPDGVIERLIKENSPGVRLVLLTAKKMEGRLLRYADGQNVVISIIDTFSPKGFVQKLFHFFYAFLIFTGSTRILATFGARADIPPAGGNRHIAPVKALIAATFGRSKFVKTKLTPWLFQKIFRKRPYKNVFDKYSPDLVVTPNLAFFPDIELVSEAKRRGVKTLGMVMNWDHLNKYYIPMHVDRLMVQNEPMRREAVGWHCYEDDQVSVVGFPQFDMYAKKEKYLLPREQFLKNFGLSHEEKIILYVSGAAYSLDEPEIIESISQWIGEGKFGKSKLMIRPYAIARDLELEQKKYARFENNHPIVFNWMRRSDNLESKKYFASMLAYSHVIISIFSTTAIEAAIFDKPTITIGFDGNHKRPYHQSIRRLEDMSHFRNVLDTGSVRVVRSFDDLGRTISAYLDNPGTDHDKRINLIDKMCHKIDGRASERIANYILGMTYG